jgi:esterase/lipase
MLLFLHDLGLSGSWWIPTIRGVLGESIAEKNDFWLKENFTLTLPGHGNRPDENFDIDDIIREVGNFQEKKYQTQREVAQKVMFSQEKQLVEAIKSYKLYVFGHSLGGVIALNLASKTQKVEKMILLNCGNNFNNFEIILKKLHLQRYNNKKRADIQKEIQKTSKIEQKTILSNFLENPNKKGYKSALSIMSQHNLERLFSHISIDQQRNIVTIPTRLFVGKSDNIVKVNSAEKLEKIFTTPILEVAKKVSDKQTIIGQNKASAIKKEIKKVDFKKIIYSNSGHNLMEKISLIFS